MHGVVRPLVWQREWVMSPVAHVVVFSELSPRARAQYTRFILDNNVKFARRPSDGRYVANVRLQPPSAVDGGDQPKYTGSPLRAESGPASPRRQHTDTVRSVQLSDEDKSNDGREGSATGSSADEGIVDSIPQRFRQFASFIHEVGNRMLAHSCMSTYVTSESKLLRLINDIYDTYAIDTLSSTTILADDRGPTTLYAFVRVYLKSRFGLRSLVEQQALELLEGLDAHKARLDVEHFALFLSGRYDTTTLAFFLKARDAAQDVVSSQSALFRPTSAASARRRRSEEDSTHRRQRRASNCAAALVWLSKSQVERAAQTTFGSKSADAYLQFAHQVRSYLATRGKPRAMRELLELQEFLSLALRTFLELKHTPTAERAGSLSSTSSGHLAHDGQETTDTSPSPSPLPPPPLPRAFGNSVRMAAPSSDRVKVEAAFGTRGRPHDGPSPVQLYPASKPQPSIGTTTKAASTDSGDDVQERLRSLMARMQQRHQSESLE